MEDIFEFGMSSVRTKWRATGWPLEEMPGVFPVDPALEPAELAQRQIRLLEAGVIGEPHPRPDSSPEVQRLFFDVIARSARTRRRQRQAADDPVALPDADPWHVRIDNGSTAPSPALAPDPDLTLETTWRDWIGGLDPGRRPAAAAAPPAAPPARLAAQPAAPATRLPRATE